VSDISGTQIVTRPHPRYWVPVIEGVVALALGIYVVLFPDDAPVIVRSIIAAALLVLSFVQIFEGFRFWNRPVSPWATLGGGVGATAAVFTLLADWAPGFPAGSARQMLAIGLAAFGIIGLVSLIFTLRSTGFKIASLIIDVLAIVLGVFLYLAEEENPDRIKLLGLAAMLGGAVLLIYGYYLWSRGRRAAVPPPPPSPPPPVATNTTTDLGE
jgi:drug/metabolite transporter (DMT)-like permease